MTSGGQFAQNIQLVLELHKRPNSPHTTYLAQNKRNAMFYAAKIIDLKEARESDLIKLKNELRIMSFCHHPNIINCLCSIVHSQSVWLLSPAMTYGSTADLLHSHFCYGLPIDLILWAAHCVLEGLEYLHSNNIVHRTLSSSHILVNQEGRVRIGGLSLCHEGEAPIHSFHSSLADFCGLQAPEVLKQNLWGYSSKCDVYSLGVTMCELINGFPPYHGLETSKIFLLKLHGEKVEACLGENLSQHSDVIDDIFGTKDIQRAYSVYQRRTLDVKVIEFLHKCQTYSPHERPSASQLLHSSLMLRAKRIGKTISRQIRSLLYPVVPVTNFDLHKLSTNLYH